MKPIRIIRDFELVGEISDYSSLSFENNYHKVGSFEITLNRYTKYADELQIGSLIVIGLDQNKVGVISHKEIQLDEEGKLSENWEIRGDTIGTFLSRRITIPPNGAYQRLTSNVESIMKAYVEANCIDTGARTIPDLVIAPNQNKGPNTFDQTRFKNLAEELERLSVFSGLGWRVSLDYTGQKFVFDVYEGTDRTAGQTEVPPVIFSTRFANVSVAEYMLSTFDFKNVAYVGGQGEGAERRIVVTGQGEGLNRYEIFVDARDVEEEEDEIPIPVNIIEQRLTDRGQQRLAEQDTEEYFAAEIIDRKGFEYEKDWFVGDIVTVRVDSWGIESDFRVVSVEEVEEPLSNRKYVVKFGTEAPDLIRKTKRSIADLSVESKM